MSKLEKSLDNVIPFPGKAVPKFGFERVKRRKAAQMEALGQLNLFSPPQGKNHVGFGRGRGTGKVIHLPTAAGPFEEALLLDDRGDKDAAKMYWKAITLGDSVADAYCNLGIMEKKKGNTSRAFNCFINSLEADPRHFQSHYNVANLYFEAGDLRLARLHYEIAAEIRPEFPNVYFNLGLVHAMEENFKAAVAALSNYKERAPQFESDHADRLLVSLEKSLTNPG
jgi:tetratricopeptide (TPR) repeat protein